MAVFNRPRNKAVLPAEVRFNPELNDGEIRAYGELVALSGKKAYCWPHNKYLAELLNKCTKTVTRALKKLKALNLIEIKNNPEMWNRREIHLMPLAGTSEASPVDINDQGGRHLRSSNSDSLLIIENNVINNDESESGFHSQKLKKREEFFKESGLVPTKEDIRKLMEEVPTGFAEGFDLELEVQKFFLHYKGNGWRMGSSKMVCLPSAIVKWFITGQNFNAK
jgi:hypothetical protein